MCCAPPILKICLKYTGAFFFFPLSLLLLFLGSKCSHIHLSIHWKKNPIFKRTPLNTEMRSNETVIADYNFYNRKEMTEDKTVKLLKELTCSNFFCPKGQRDQNENLRSFALKRPVQNVFVSEHWLFARSPMNSERAVTNEINAGTVSKATLGQFLQDGVVHMWVFLSAQIPSWTE